MKVTHHTLLDTRQKYSPLVEIKKKKKIVEQVSIYLSLSWQQNYSYN
jgi:hypothetical protein